MTDATIMRLCPVCKREWRFLAAHLWVAHGERLLGWVL